ncbi:23S rRNA (pseudouridine(1915)-N(3))-methyltransferase RlmH [Aquitalea sp. S1-19]|uniref:Ribosomal RNA large subunit methyltransferase H n=1 Tax=Craterilacuibacter sinensis TaxID=2686017 RepID=A0A845BIM4_9NEIS|nr:23S rRNA (pseudouridine(1915)-N(3))-methyltransferase RlmH [Craterilacuibacter sinensis]MCP9759950.1 23S rRNA (pseudouridine(1915)-N(3))-methyltransferase RlmH [Aquitalea sp. S1-19]MXR36022.1 23S rRNA (pseudouridine(1915)-N(3))-methyltransferase RlmH [Craterilacuibacter sinensis]RQW28309.1 23S rRNA (pseudouridine(1915)-N(3))-methyltransferase RlmH [Rhodobacteraceae bacterium CH30]
MKITLLAVGTKMPRWVDEAFGDYAKRFGRDISFELKEIKPEKRGGGVTTEKGIAAEHERLIAAIAPRTKLVVLDERGKNWTSVQLAGAMKDWMAGGDDITIIIGGADGLSAELKQKADVLLQLSAMTLPHGMVRVMLAEQLYRAYSILNNHPYHRE